MWAFGSDWGPRGSDCWFGVSHSEGLVQACRIEGSGFRNCQAAVKGVMVSIVDGVWGI